MSSFTAVLLAVMTWFMSMFSAYNTIEVKENKSDFEPAVRFAVMSDTHITTLADANSFKIQKAVNLAYDKAEECSTYKNLDGIMFVGDITDDGTKWQFDSFAAAVSSVIKDGTQLMAVCASAHDTYQYKKECRDILSEITGNDPDWNYEINGYHFIGLSTSPDPDKRYTSEQIEWLDSQIAAAVRENPDRPVFVCNHEHVYETVYGSFKGEWGTEELKAVLEKYPQVVHFSGHSHYPLNDPRSIWQDGFTCIGTGAITYMEFTVDEETRIHPDNYRKAGQFWLVEADAEGNVRLRGYDVWGANLLCEYILNNPCEKENRTYNADAEKNAAVPAFTGEAGLKVSGVGGNATVTIPAANAENGIVFLYRVNSYGADGSQIDSQWVLNNSWTYPCCDNVKVKVKAEKGGYIEAFAENSYGVKSEPLTAEVK